MFNQISRVRAVSLFVFGAALFLSFTLLAAVGTSQRTPLASDELARSRGNNQDLVLLVLTCNALQGNQPCSQQGAACTTCSVYGYTTVTGGSNGGYDPGAAQGGICGILYSGVCQPNLSCNQEINIGSCALPPGPVNVQPAFAPDR